MQVQMSERGVPGAPDARHMGVWGIGLSQGKSPTPGPALSLHECPSARASGRAPGRAAAPAATSHETNSLAVHYSY